jgi:hypothetical protein
VADELATLAAKLAEDMLLDAADIAVDMVADPVAVPVAVELLTAVAVWPAAQEAAVGRFVTPAGTQMPSAYLIVAIVKRENGLFPLRNIILTLLVRFVADLCDAACYCFDETRVGADAFRIQVAGTRDRIYRAVLLRI